MLGRVASALRVRRRGKRLLLLTASALAAVAAAAPAALTDSTAGAIDPSTVPPGTCTSDGAGNVACHDKLWTCEGAVSLSSVSVLIDQTGTGDAVKLAHDCTGLIGEIDVTQWQGDGIHVVDAHDLTVGGGTIRCYAHTPLKHQDGVQVLGGLNVELDNLDVGCYSANNSQVWINNGSGVTGSGGVPTNVVFVGGRFDGQGSGAYGVMIGSSVGSGFENAVICPNHKLKRQLYVSADAVSPVGATATNQPTDGNTLATSC